MIPSQGSKAGGGDQPRARRAGADFSAKMGGRKFAKMDKHMMNVRYVHIYIYYVYIYIYTWSYV